MHKITNYGKGPRMANAIAGAVLLEPGESHTGEYEDGELLSMLGYGDYGITEVTENAVAAVAAAPKPEPVAIEMRGPSVSQPDSHQHERKKK